MPFLAKLNNLTKRYFKGHCTQAKITDTTFIKKLFKLILADEQTSI